MESVKIAVLGYLERVLSLAINDKSFNYVLQASLSMQLVLTLKKPARLSILFALGKPTVLGRTFSAASFLGQGH